ETVGISLATNNAKARLLGSADDRGRCGIWGVWRSAVRAGCGNRSRALEYLSWRGQLRGADLLFIGWAAADCGVGWPRHVCVWAIAPPAVSLCCGAARHSADARAKIQRRRRSYK